MSIDQDMEDGSAAACPPSTSSKPEPGPMPNFRHARTLTGHARAVVSSKFSPHDGQLIATGSADSTIRIWDTASGEQQRVLEGHEQGVNDVAWSPQGTYVASASDDNTLKIWDVETGKALKTLVGHTHFVFCCNWHPQSHILASGSFDETLRVWDVRSGKCLREVPAHSDPITGVHFNADGTLIASSSLDGLCRIWETESGHCLKTIFDKDSSPVSHVRFTPNGKHILSSSLDGQIRLWDFERGKAVKTYKGHTNSQFCLLSTLCTTGGGSWVVTGSEDHAIYVYGLNRQQVLQTIPGRGSPEEPGEGHADRVLCVDAHPVQPLLVSSGHSRDPTARIWQHT